MMKSLTEFDAGSRFNATGPLSLWRRSRVDTTYGAEAAIRHLRDQSSRCVMPVPEFVRFAEVMFRTARAVSAAFSDLSDWARVNPESIHFGGSGSGTSDGAGKISRRSPRRVPDSRTTPAGSSRTEWAVKQVEMRQGAMLLLTLRTRFCRSM